MASSDKGYADPFVGIHEPFIGLSEMDFELHDIYMDHEPEEEFVSSLDKCKDIFLNVLLSDENLRNSSMVDEIRAEVYHATDWQSDEDEQEVKGELLTTIGRDANNQVYPIAWAVVDVENKSNWTWFLELLIGDLDLIDGRGLVVISDQHKILQLVSEQESYL
ncbi:unnamed protein product [Lactuca saligna]|uniref:MULE transposase domain-containing protein n=1 Tax=Lactuca saligna TaxID=75948 RepID=A0AA35ZLI3_LACSI|nr:unnamed protein product [Lactuca saligna]